MNDLNEYIKNNPEKWELECLEFYLGSLSDEDLKKAGKSFDDSFLKQSHIFRFVIAGNHKG